MSKVEKYVLTYLLASSAFGAICGVCLGLYNCIEETKGAMIKKNYNELVIDGGFKFCLYSLLGIMFGCLVGPISPLYGLFLASVYLSNKQLIHNTK